jgi:trigger factor
MKTSLEKLDGLKRALAVDLSIDIFRQKTDQILRGMASKVTVDGFRKGKVPLSIMGSKHRLLRKYLSFTR